MARVDTGPGLGPLEPPRLVIAPAMGEQASPGGDYNVRAARVLGLAQEMADRVTGEAKAEADGMLGDARVRSEELLSGARAKADGLVTEARTRAETMLNDARSKAEIVARRLLRVRTPLRWSTSRWSRKAVTSGASRSPMSSSQGCVRVRSAANRSSSRKVSR